VAAAAILTLTFAATPAAHAADQLYYGVSSLHFAWTPPTTGSASGYLVSRSLNGGAFQLYSIVTQPEVVIPVSVGDQLMVAVAATGYDSTGAYQVGPQSPVSDRIWVVPSPRLAGDGSWLLQCSSCPQLQRRSVADASLILASAPGLPLPWRVLGMAKLKSGREQIIWQNPTTGEMAVWDEQFLAPVPNGTGIGGADVRAVGAVDFDGDGVEEFVVQRNDTGLVAIWGLKAGGLQRLATITGPPGALLAAARDFNRDGKIDLLWHDPVLGTLDLWRLVKDPLDLLPLSSLLGGWWRIASGIPSDAVVVSTGDYNGDGSLDVLLRYAASGQLAISYLVAGQPGGYVALPLASGDVNRRVVDSADFNGVAGDEIAVQDRITKLISIVLPWATSAAGRIPVLNPGGEWKAVGVGS
jgi:hypothetical protein